MGWGGGFLLLPYISHKPKGMVFSLFWSETGIHFLHFAHFGLESGMVFEEITGVCERIYRLK